MAIESSFTPRTVASENQSAWIGREQGDGLSKFFDAMRRSLGLSLLIIALSVGGAVYVSRILQSYWRVEIVVMPVNHNDPSSLNSSSPALASLGPLLDRRDTLKDEALAVLRSRELFDTYAKQKNLLPLLFEERWDTETNSWKVPEDRVPTLREAYRRFDGSVRDIEEDRRTGIVTLALTWRNREQAVVWAREMIELADKQLRTRALDDAERNMRYLTEEMRNPNRPVAQNALNNALASAYEKQLQNYMFAKGQSEFAFRIIDQPTVPDERERVSPKTMLIVLAGAVGGFVLAVFAAYARSALRRRRARLRAV